MVITDQHRGILSPLSLLHQHYMIVGQAGRGGMGTVYQAIDTRVVQRQVAIKEMSRSALSKDQVIEAMARFQREAAILSSLSHPNLPHIYDAFSEQERTYFVMDYIEGKTLYQLLKEGQWQALPVSQVLRYVIQLCDVLAYLHGQTPSIIFRDVKPANIMVTQTGQIFLIDFGIARFFKEGQEQDTAFLGSRGYASPEQHGICQTNPRTDVYGLGATLHFCLTGRDPYYAADRFAFSPIQQVNPQVPPALAELVHRMVALDEQLRPTNMLVVQQVLIAIARQVGIYPGDRSRPRNVLDPSFFDLPTVPVPVIPVTPAPKVQRARADRDVDEVTDRLVPGKGLEPSFSDLPTIPVPIASAMPVPKAQLVESDEMVDRYAKWLEVNNTLPVAHHKIQAYQDAALKTKKVGRRQICTFAPFQEQTSALKVITPDQVVILAILILSWVISLLLFHLAMLTITVGVITLLYICGFGLSSILATRSLKNSSCGEKIDEEIIHALDQRGVTWPTYTILCPLYKEAIIVPQFVEAIKALDYPVEKLQVLFLTEEDDQQTRTALYGMHLPSSFTVLTVPKGFPQTKPRACNFGLLQAKGQFIVIFDAEDKPEPSQLKKAILTFANHGPEVACVQAKLNFYNAKQNLLTRWFTAEYSTWFDIILPGLQRSGLSLPLGGTSNHFRTEALRALGGWDAFNVTEDCDLGLRISRYGLKTAVVDSTTYEEATSRVKSWLFQRSRWIKGYLQTYLVYMRHPVHMLRKGHIRTFLSLQLIVGAWTAVLLINPLMWASTLFYMLFHPVHLYSMLFTGPLLYLGAVCLIFGNFFYLYIQLIGCLRRKEYALMKWIVFTPLYWIMMSVSAYIAFYQLIVKPHYWEKTQHGSHLTTSVKEYVPTSVINGEQERRAVVASMPTAYMLAMTLSGVLKRGATSTLGSPTQRVAALQSTLSARLGQPTVRRQIRLPRIQDGWLLVTILIASIASVTSTWYVFLHHEVLIYGDQVSHLQLARHLFDSLTPGLAQLGGVWLPLPHLLMEPFIWNDYLWQTGLAGSAIGMGCYLITAIYTFLTIKRLTKSSCVSFIGSLIFILNPNVLYLQATPLTEPVCWATYSMASYYLLAWAQEDTTKYLLLTAATTCLATLARFDGWILVILFPIVIIITGLLRHHPAGKIKGNVGIFLALSSLGIVLWNLWEQIIFGNALYWLDGPYSSWAEAHSPTEIVLHRQIWSHPLLAVKLYGICTVETIGIAMVVLAALGTLVYILRNWKQVDMLASLTHWAPFVFYVLALYLGEVSLFNLHVGFYPLGIIPMSESANLFNSRFGSEVVAPAAVFIALLIPVRSLPKLPAVVGQWILFHVRELFVVLIILQSAWIAYGGVISVMSNINPPFCVNTYSMDTYLQQHYNGGLILQTESPFHLSEGQAGIHLSNVVYDGSGKFWNDALKKPASVVDWVIFQPGDRVANNMKADGTSFSLNFTLVATDPSGGLLLYHKNALPPLPTRPISSYLLNEKQFCSSSTYQQKGEK